MIIQKAVIRESLQCVKDSNNGRQVDKNAIAAVRTNLNKYKRGLDISIIVSMFSSLALFTLDVFPTGKCVSDTREYGLEIHATFHIYEPEKTIKFAKQQNKKY